MNVVGLKGIQDWVTSYTFSPTTFPKSLILEGDMGSGRHLVANLINQNLSLSNEPVMEITDDISSDLIDGIYTSTTPVVYFIDGSKLSVSNQQKILKLIEEPPLYAYMIISCKNRFQLSETIRNRCIIKSMDTYSAEELGFFGGIDILIANTPGKQILWKNEDIPTIRNICKNIFEYIKTVNYPNLLSISGKFKYGEKDSGHDFNLFLSLLKEECKEAYKRGIIPFEVVSRTASFMSDCSISNLNRKNLLELYLTDIRYDTY